MKPNEPNEPPIRGDRVSKFTDDLGDGSIAFLDTFGEVVAAVPDVDLERDTTPAKGRQVGRGAWARGHCDADTCDRGARPATSTSDTAIF
jgi:hypothetical protein